MCKHILNHLDTRIIFPLYNKLLKPTKTTFNGIIMLRQNFDEIKTVFEKNGYSINMIVFDLLKKFKFKLLHGTRGQGQVHCPANQE